MSNHALFADMLASLGMAACAFFAGQSYGVHRATKRFEAILDEGMRRARLRELRGEDSERQ